MLHGSKLEAESEFCMQLEVPDLNHKDPSIMMFWRENHSHLHQKSPVCGSKSVCL